MIRSEPVGDDRATEGSIKSAQRVLEVFEFFAERRRPARVAEIVQVLGYPQSSASALLKCLVRMKYLDYDHDTRCFQPTLRVALLGSWVHDQLFSDRSLLRLLESLQEATGCMVLVGLRNDIYVQYIHLLPGSEIVWYIKPGSLRPLCRAAAGQVLLAQMTDVEVMGLVRRINAETLDPEKRVSPHALLQELEQVRERGYGLTQGAVIPTHGVIAMELPTPPSQPPMALGIGGENALILEKRDEIVTLLRDTLAPYARSASLMRG